MLSYFIGVLSISDLVLYSGKKLAGDIGKAIITGASAGVANALGQKYLNNPGSKGPAKDSSNSGDNSGDNSGGNSGGNSNTNK